MQFLQTIKRLFRRSIEVKQAISNKASDNALRHFRHPKREIPEFMEPLKGIEDETTQQKLFGYRLNTQEVIPVIITIANQKGGVGKTSTAAALAQAAVSRGKKVLTIDLDPQGNLSAILASNTRGKGSFHLLNGAEAKDVIQHLKSGIDAISASRDLATIASSKGSAWRLRNALEPLKGNYDCIIIDTPPLAGELQFNALMASTHLIIPLQADILSLQGLYQMADTAQQICKANKDLKHIGYVLTCYDGRSTIKKKMAETIREKTAGTGIAYYGAIRAAVALNEAQALQQSLFEYAPKSKPAIDYMNLFETIQN